MSEINCLTGLACPDCGGAITGDGYATAQACENAVERDDCTPDGPVRTCGFTDTPRTFELSVIRRSYCTGVVKVPAHTLQEALDTLGAHLDTGKLDELGPAWAEEHTEVLEIDEVDYAQEGG